MKIAAITNGISGNYETCCQIMNETGLEYAELQHLDGKQNPALAIGEKRSVPGVPVETLELSEAHRVKALSEKYHITPVIITSHAFVGLPVRGTELWDPVYTKHMELLKNAIAFAKICGVKMVRAMCFGKQPVMFGSHGAGEWLANDNSVWPKFVSLYQPIAQLAVDEDIDIVVENGNGMICSSLLMRRLWNDLKCERIKYLWDLSNAMYYAENPTLETYAMVKDILGHIHVKDMNLNIPGASMEVTKIGEGQLGPYLPLLAQALRRDGYAGCVSLENIYKPDGGDFVDGYRIDIAELKRIFG